MLPWMADRIGLFDAAVTEGCWNDAVPLPSKAWSAAGVDTICGDSGAGVVKVPYEHAVFERKLKELRYETGDPGNRLAMLHEVGGDMGRILGAVPGLPGPRPAAVPPERLVR